MKIAFVLMPERGHVNPFIGPAQALQSMGHGVVVAAPGDISPQIERARLRFCRDLIAEAPPPVAHGHAQIGVLEEPARLRALIQGFLLDVVETQVATVSAFLKREAPDGVVIDPMQYGAAIAAETLGIPWVSVSSSLSMVLTDDVTSVVRATIDELSPLRAEVFRRHGMKLEFRASDVISPLLNITFATADFVGEPPRNIELLGLSEPLFERGDEVAFVAPHTTKPIVYLSLGSQLSCFPEIFEKVLGACREVGVFAALSMGDLVDDPRWKFSAEDCLLYRYAPQRELLKRAAVFVTHGGANSVMEGLSAGVPLLVTPICNDQFHQAHFVAKAGVGRVLDMRTASVDTIRAELQIVLESSSIRSAVDAIARGYKINGAMRAAQLIAAAFQARI